MTAIFNNHNVYIIGAGFSAARGLPLISDFMFALRDAHAWLEGEGRAQEAASVKRVLEFRQRSTPSAYRVKIDLENIEELFSLASAIDDSLTDDIRTAVAATLEYCAAVRQDPTTRYNLTVGGPTLPACLTAQVTTPGVGPLTSQLEAPMYSFMLSAMLGLLGAETGRATNAVVSFNYDTIVEESLTALQVPFSYGFAPKSVILDVSARRLHLSPKPGVQLLKLHGSVNWAYPGGRGGRMTVFGSYEAVRQKQHVPELVPPTWNKSFAGPLIYVWREALMQISRATRLVIVGFSMPATDLHFKYLIAAGLRENISLREIVFVNVDTNAIEERAEQLFGEFRRRPEIRMVSTEARNFCTQGMLPSTMWSIGRPMRQEIQSVYHSS